MSLTHEQIQFIQSWKHNPVKFCYDVFKIDPDEWQRDPLGAVVDNEKIALFGAKGVGKSFIAACIGWWWYFTNPKAQVICTSKDADNLQDGLWKEIGSLYSRSALLKHLFTFNTERITAKEDPIDWFMAARGWRKHADPVEQAQALAGKHGPAMMWLGDEAGSYGKAIVASGMFMLANATPESGNKARIVLSGNTTDPSGALGDIARDRASWHIVKITGDPDDPKRSKRVREDLAREMIAKYGRTNPWVKVAIFAEFPDTGFSSLLGPNDIDASIRRVYAEEAYQHSQKRLLVDVARFGDDATVIGLRQGLKAGPFIEMRGADTQQVADRVMLALERTKAEIVYVDETGVGAGVVDALRRHRVRVIGVNNSGTPNEPDKYYNKRAENCWLAAQWVKNGGWLPVEPKVLLDEAVQPTYLFKNGLMLIEAKEQIKLRLGKSPDFWDCFCLSFSSPDMPAGDPFKLLEMMTKHSAGADFDPHRSLSRGVSNEFDPLSNKL